MPDATLQGSWVTSYSGWMHFDPRAEPKIQPPPQDTLETFTNRVSKLPPLFGGNRVVPRFFFGGLGFSWYLAGHSWARLVDRYEQREGYFAFAALACLKFDGNGGLTGITRFNRGGVGKLNETTGISEAVKNELTGAYSAALNTAMGITEGTYHTLHRNLGDEPVRNDYTFFVRSDDELEWIWVSSRLQSPTTTRHPVDTPEVSDRVLAVPPQRALVTHGTLRRVTSTMT